MTISDSDYKILWARAAGLCCNPDCREDLTVTLKNRHSYVVGEMAHIIAKSSGGPRGQAGGGSDSYENLILLCPTCHTNIDKAPAEYPERLLTRWKGDREDEVRTLGLEKKFQTITSLKENVANLLSENRALWKTFGPRSEAATSDPASNLYLVWQLRKLDTILPNNRRIINSIEANINLISESDRDAFMLFKLHALAFEEHQFARLDKYPLFPAIFEETFRP
jgi:hypothetical protein